MPSEIVTNAILIIVVLAVLELIKLIIRGGFKKVTGAVTTEEFDEFKKECESCQKMLPEKYVLYSRYKEDIAEIKKEQKEGLEGIWKKIDELVKLYYED